MSPQAQVCSWTSSIRGGTAFSGHRGDHSPDGVREESSRGDRARTDRVTASNEGDGPLGGAWSIPRGPRGRVHPLSPHPSLMPASSACPGFLPVPVPGRLLQKNSAHGSPPPFHPGSCLSWLALFLAASLAGRALTATPAGLSPPVPQPYQATGELAYGQLKGAPGK